jgi:hypothetical protein
MVIEVQEGDADSPAGSGAFSLSSGLQETGRIRLIGLRPEVTARIGTLVQPIRGR